jgi:hypothetical protein
VLFVDIPYIHHIAKYDLTTIHTAMLLDCATLLFFVILTTHSFLCHPVLQSVSGL